MALGVWIKVSQEDENIYIPFSGEKSFNRNLLPILIKDDSFWLFHN